jgi:transcriptional regulator with XRE-family HTH domain
MDHNLDKEGEPLVLHLRHMRQMAFERDLLQEEVATLTGISRRQLSRYETGARLPDALSLLRLVLAYEKKFIEFFDPQVVAHERAQIEERRELLGLKSAQPQKDG